MARFAFYFLIFLCAFCGPSISEEYQLPQNTDVTFKYSVAGLPFEGEFKVTESKFDINFRNPVQSVFSVKFDLMKSNAGFPLATTAMKQVLDAYRFPEVTFESKSVEFNDENIAVLQFGGGCQGCGMVDVTLKDGIEKTLIDQIPEVKAVKDLTDHSINDNAYYK